MGVVRAGVIIYTDLELLGWLLGSCMVSYINLIEAERLGTPYAPLYEAGIRYEPEPKFSEVWQTTRFVYAAKAGDCEDLTSVRVSQLWRAGETAARPDVARITPRLRHVRVMRADGTIEDPSLILGMRKRRNPLGWKAEADEALARVLPIIQTPEEPLPWGLPVSADDHRQPEWAYVKDEDDP